MENKKPLSELKIDSYKEIIIENGIIKELRDFNMQDSGLHTEEDLK